MASAGWGSQIRKAGQMPGYVLLEQNYLATFREEGIMIHGERYGILDFLRELADGECSFPRMTKLRVVGLEEVLFAAQPNEREIALIIHQRLQRASSALETKLLSVQFIFTGTLRRGDKLWCEYRNARLPIDLIWSSPLPEHDEHGNTFYRATFHLSSPTP
jgi:hypothetical protein